MKIGEIKINSTPVLALAPMAGYTNIAFRELIAKNNADITYSELASATALAREKNPNESKTASIISSPKYGISAVQLFGANESEFKFAINYVCQKIDSQESYTKFIDINLGCPAPKVTKSGSGSQLLQNSNQLQKIAKIAIKSSSVPITAKLRLLPNIIDSIRIAKMLQKEGFCALTFHGRTQKQKYSGSSNWSAIAKIKQILDIPIIANGDIKTPQDVKKCLELTNCDAAMIGRASLANPYIFTQIRQFYKTKKYQTETFEQKIVFLKKYLRLCKKYNIKFIYAKELAMQFISGFAGAAQLRKRVSISKNETELISCFETQQ